MLTPRFELSQNEQELTIKVYAPYANIKDTEVYVERADFRFFSNPYYLRLQLPGEIVENDHSSGSYDCDSGLFVLKFSKVNPGEHFDNLDMITTLLAPPREKKNIVPTIEVISNSSVTDEHDLIDDENDEEWFVPQTAPDTRSSTNLLTAPKYGFANRISGALGSFEEGWLKDVVDLPFPDSTPMQNRKSLREAEEKRHFSDDHYTADLMQPEDSIKHIIDYRPSFCTWKSEELEFSKEEIDLLKEMPNKEFLLTNQETELALLSLVDILFSCCYNYRTTIGENTSESCWNISKISATLSWLDYFSSLNDVLKSCMRRSLCYPLYRHWDLSLKVLQDVKTIMGLGKKSIVQKLCDIHSLFNHSYEPRYILNQLYIKDYIIWVQKLPDSMIRSIVEELQKIKIQKKDLELDLIELEAAAWSVFEESIDGNVAQATRRVPEDFINSIVDGVNKLVVKDEAINEQIMSSDSDDDTSSSTETSDSSDTTTMSSSDLECNLSYNGDFNDDND